MRFYYLILTLFLLTLNLIAQSADAIKLSSDHIALIQSEGAKGIQTVFRELDIQIQDLQLVEDFASSAVSGLITRSTNTEAITEISAEITVALAEIASSENINVSYVVEYTSAGITDGVIKATQNNNLDVFQSIANGSKGAIAGAIEFSVDTRTNIGEVVSALGSGYLAGTIEASNDIKLNIIKAVEACSNGLIVGTINTALKSNVEIYETLASTCEGIAEAAVEASVREQLDLIKQITAASVGAGESAVKTATALSLDLDQTQKAILMGLRRGATDSIPGKGNNIRIIIAPQKDINVQELINAISSGMYQGGMQRGFIPIIETPYEDDGTVRQVSPI